MLAIYKREVRSYFNSMIGCVFAAFLTIIGGVYFMVYNLYSGYPFFAYSLAGVIFMLLISVPVLSMKSFAEDRKNKTDQLLLTSPVSLVEIVLGKYLAMVTVFAIPCVIYCIFPLIIKLQGTAHFLVDYSSILAFFLLGCVFIAISNLVIWIIIFALIGLLIYHITKNQMIAGIVTSIGCIAGIVVYFVKKTLLESLFSTLLGHLVLTDIFYNFSQNYIFDLGGLLTYLSLIILLVFLTIQTFEKRRWS